MNKIFCATLSLIVLAAFTANSSAPAGSEKLTRMLQLSTLTLLKEGNVRFVEGKSFHPNLEISRRAELASAGQEPSATILSCSDSRAPLEAIFDRGVGDLFVIRVAGNVAGLSELATMEYGVTHLGTPLLIVMGHTRCGAVTAAVKGTELHGHLPSLISLIRPAADKAKISASEEESVMRAIELNIWQQVENIFNKSAAIRESVAQGKVQVIGAIYDIATGRVQWLGQHPEINRLVADAKASQKPDVHAEQADIPAPAKAILVEVAKPPVQEANPAPQYPAAHIEAVRAVKTEDSHAPANPTVKTAAARKTSAH